jgi:DNA (cytosine-5)-methyltransferase 1
VSFMRPRLHKKGLRGGGASMGYFLAGFDILGIDLFPQPDYPFDFIRYDSLEYVSDCGYLFDFIHASPPCQAFSSTKHLVQAQQRQVSRADLLDDTRALLKNIGKPTEFIGTSMLKTVYKNAA